MALSCLACNIRYTITSFTVSTVQEQTHLFSRGTLKHCSVEALLVLSLISPAGKKLYTKFIKQSTSETQTNIQTILNFQWACDHLKLK